MTEHDSYVSKQWEAALASNEIHALIVKGERQLVELKRELLSALKKELGS